MFDSSNINARFATFYFFLFFFPVATVKSPILDVIAKISTLEVAGILDSRFTSKATVGCDT